jgi:cation diffusion facilitator CzcD-associated flavoprotein CzcO
LGYARKALGPDYDVDTHFTPDYNPWDQRLCLIPNGDLFEAIKSGNATVETDHIDRFDASGILLKSGKLLEADIIVTATGLNMLVLGGIKFNVDGKVVNFADTWSYRGLMYSGVPNLVNTFGYINASWTLRADITAEYFCRLINYMDTQEASQVVPELREADKGSMVGPGWMISPLATWRGLCSSSLNRVIRIPGVIHRITP